MIVSPESKERRDSMAGYLNNAARNHTSVALKTASSQAALP